MRTNPALNRTAAGELVRDVNVRRCRLVWCSPEMGAERAKLKSRRDDVRIAPGKRSAARGYSHKRISSFFPSGLAPPRCAKPEGKKEIGLGGFLPRAAAATLPWAIIRPPPPGLRKGEPACWRRRRDCVQVCTPAFSSLRASSPPLYVVAVWTTIF